MEQAILLKEYDNSPFNKGYKKSELTSPNQNVKQFLIAGACLVISGNAHTLDNDFERMLPKVQSTVATKQVEQAQKSIPAKVYNNYMGISGLIIDLDSEKFKGIIMANTSGKDRKLMEPIAPSSDIIDNKDITGEGKNMLYERLISKRNNFENQSIIFGLLITILSSIIPLIIDIPFAAIAPAPFLFLTLVLFMAIRKFSRRIDK